MWNPFSRKTRTAPQTASSDAHPNPNLHTRSDNPFVRAASAAGDPLWFADPEGRIALMVLPASGTGVFAMRGGLGLDGRARELAERQASGNRTDFRAVIVTPEAAAEGLGSASTSAAEALGFEWERRLGLARRDVLWASGGPVGETLEVGTLIGAASALREAATHEAGTSDPPFGPLRRMPFLMPEGRTELALWETPPALDLARASVLGLHVGFPVRRNILEVFAETLAPKLWAGLHPSGAAGDLLVITASGEAEGGVGSTGNASQPPVERWDDPRVEPVSAGLAGLLEGALRSKGRKRRRKPSNSRRASGPRPARRDEACRCPGIPSAPPTGSGFFGRRFRSAFRKASSARALRCASKGSVPMRPRLPNSPRASSFPSGGGVRRS